MGNDDRLSMDLGVPAERTEWAKWVDPDRRAAQVRKFLEQIGFPDRPLTPWEFESTMYRCTAISSPV
ncbi:hypothetical protein [Nocardia sp. NPDC004604]|uniref:hypothetical protein n=1 Tax=Nocardia sp. NPDC004604 TaxID=3157013 RepID=UPI0033ABA4AC